MTNKKMLKINKNIIIYTGYIYEELIKKDDSVINEILSKRDLTLTFRGSSNQRFIDMNKKGLKLWNWFKSFYKLALFL